MKRFSLIIGALLLGLVMRAQSVGYSYRYWFDQEHGQIAVATVCNNLLQMELDTESLSEGIHLLYVQVKDSVGHWCSPEHYMFYKALSQSPVNQNDVMYHCWFDQDIEHMQSGEFGTGHFLLDTEGLDPGIHLLYVILESDGLTSAESYMFYKAPAESPINLNNLMYHCWFDQDHNALQTGLLGNGVFELDTDSLSAGIHTLYVQLGNDPLTTPQCFLFYKKLEREQIARWEYWLNDDVNNRHTTNLSPFLDSLSIISLLPVESRPIRSTCFHFHPNGDEPCLNAKNMITFRFWSTQHHFIEQSKYFVDENVSEPIVADTLDRNTTVSIAAPRNNQIHWFKMAVSRGDYLSLQADKVCTMQLFAPSGEEVYNVSGPESIQEIGLNAWEDGNYYLAVHDVTGIGETVSVTYNWVYRYSILAYDVHLVGNGGCSTITFKGNGFNSLLDVYLVNAQNDTIRQLDIGHESNTTTTVSWNFYQENMGVYDAVFEFYEETIRINGALEVQEPVDIVLTSTVSYPSAFLRNTPCTYTYTITNNGNMSAYAVPIYVYVSSQTKDGISHLEFDGLDLPSVIDGIDLDSLSVSDRMWLQNWADEIGEDHYFFKNPAVDERTGDSVFVRSNYFFLTLAPFETKTLTLEITADEAIYVWMTVPIDTILPLLLSPVDDYRGGNRGFYCCAQEQIQCTLSLICSAISIASLVPAWAAPMAVAECVCGLISEINDVYSYLICDGNNNTSYWEKFKNMKKSVSVVNTLVACIKKNNPIGKIREILDAIDAVINGLTLGDITHDVSDCIEKWKSVNPNCPPGPHGGGGGGAGPVYSLDPNDIHGYLSESGSHYMRQEIQNVQYEIEFENDTTLATAAAHTIIVRDTLDATKFDLNSLAARSVTIGDKRLNLNGEQTFARTLDMRPELYVIAQIEQNYDPTTGIVEWTIQSLDPMTMEPTDGPNQGVLPVNYFGNGVGFIDYSINLKQAFADGTAISNRAGIIFDQNDVIMTPTWTNIVDAIKPISHIEGVTIDTDTLNFNFVSSDNRSGVWYHTLYYRNDSTEMEWKIWKNQIVEDHYKLVLENHLFTEYLVMATDSAGNHEDKNLVAEYTYGDQCQIQTKALQTGWNWFSTNLDISLADLKSALVDALENTDIQIKSKIAFTKYTGNTWRGTLNSMDVAQMYKINVPSDCVITLFGNPINPTEHPVTINKGANWIGFPFNSDMSLSTAFNGFAVSGDMVKSKDRYSSFNGNKWRGTFNTLEFGKGYIYKTNVQNSRTFTFPINTK